ncbi:MAG: hypothetical protein J6A63_00415 [Clostridia bacterium]|nr:hypothetical protein [Clostridia bacterium]
MTQDKMRKLVTACAVAATTLLVVLLAVLIYQWITYGVLKSRREKLEAENQKLEQLIEEGKMDAEYYESVMGKEWLAFQQGFVKPQGE